MINKEHLIDNLIIPALTPLSMATPSGVMMMARTCAVESDLCTNWVQLGNGPAKNPWGVEPATFDFIWDKYLLRRKDLKDIVIDSCNLLQKPYYNDLTYNIRLCIQIARLKYWTVEDALPDADNMRGQGVYWKKYYNTEGGRGTVDKFIAKSIIYRL